jgi:O-antigen/teichoic acid export membrane protein
LEPTLDRRMARASNSWRLINNSAWNAAAFGIGAALNLLVLPFALHRLGVAAFGVAGLIAACIAPAMIFSNALSLAAAREFAQWLTAEQRDEARNVFASALLLALVVGVSIVLLLVLGGPPLARLAFHLTAETAPDLGLTFAFGAAGWFCQCLATVFLALFVARQDYARISSISIFNVVVATGAMLLLIPQRPLASTFLGCQALGFAASLAAALFLSSRSLGGWLAAPAFHRSAADRLVRFGIWQLLAQGGSVATAQVDRYLLGALLAPQFVGFYVIAQRLEEAVYIGILKIGEILFPFFSVLQNETADRKADMFFRSSWVLNVLAASALGGLIPTAGSLLTLWTGAGVADQTEQLLVVLSIAGILGCSANVFAFYLLANGKSRYNALISLVTTAFTLATSCIVLPLFGWTAAGWSTCAGMSAQIVTIAWLLRETFDRAQVWSRVSHLVAAPLLAGIVTALLLRHVVDPHLFQQPHWWSVAVLYGLSAAIILVAVVAVSQIGPYGAACRQDIGSILHRFSPARTR